MTPIRFFAEGLPKGQPRPRAFAINGKARVYDAGTAEGWKSAVATAARPFLTERITEPVKFSCTFFFPRPKSHYFTGKRSAVLRDDAPDYNAKKPDIDNALKAVMDALVVLGMFSDDSLIVQVDAAKVYVHATCGRAGAYILIEPADPLYANTLSETSVSPKSEGRAAQHDPGSTGPGAETTIAVTT